MSPPEKRNSQSASADWFAMASKWFSMASKIVAIVVPIALVVTLLAFLYLGLLGG